MEGILLDRECQIYNYLRPSAVEQIFEEHRSGQNDNHKILFSLVVFEEWLRAQSCARPGRGHQAMRRVAELR